MATSTRKLQVKFGTMSGTKTWSFANAPASVSADSVKTLANTMIENGSIYRYPPLTLDSAEIITTTKDEININ